MAIVSTAGTYAGYPVGLEVANCDVVLEAHAAIAAGAVVSIDPSEVSVNMRFTKTAALAAASAGSEQVDQVDGGIIAVALEDVASGALGKFRVQGVVTAEADGGVAKGDMCGGNVGGDGFKKTGAAGDKVFAIALEAISLGAQGSFMIDGLNGFGIRHA